jgi:hypothetical protein
MDAKKLEAYCSIVHAISEHAREKARHDDAHLRKYYPHLASNEIIYSNDYMSTFEAVADALDRLDTMKPLDRCCSLFTCEPQQVYELAKANWSSGPSFSELLKEFIELFGEFGADYWGFGTSADIPFKPKSETLTTAMNALVSVGYAEQLGDSYRWIGKVGAAMAAAGFWPESANN